MIEATCFIHSELNHLFRAWSESKLTENDTLAPSNDRFNGMTDLVDFDAQIAEHLRGNALPFAYQSQKKMLCADVVVLEVPRFFLRQRQNVTCSFGEQVEATNKIRRSCVLPLEVILKIGRGKAVIGTDTIGRKLAFVDQTANRDWINM